MPSEGYDTAQICLNGHVATGSYHDSPEFRQDYCKHCGVKTTIHCSSCNKEINGRFRGHMSLSNISAPSFCIGCGKPYPWTAAKVVAAKAMVDELSNLDESERVLLKASIDDIAADTPMTQVAVVRVKKLIPKMGDLAPAMRKLFVDVAGKAAAEMLKGGK